MRGVIGSIGILISFGALMMVGILLYQRYQGPEKIMDLPAEQAYQLEGKPFEDKNGATVQLVSSDSRLYLVFVGDEPLPKRFAITRKTKSGKLELVNLDP
ncbi:hypothetical protein KW786_01335 [Candidatus Parcubacteria bacterium]|nr:hypothetical protein [Candidatus Parcubacteria bacterium]